MERALQGKILRVSAAQVVSSETCSESPYEVPCPSRGSTPVASHVTDAVRAASVRAVAGCFSRNS